MKLIKYFLFLLFFATSSVHSQALVGYVVSHSGKLSPTGELEDVVGTNIGFTLTVSGTENTDQSFNVVWTNTDSPVLSEEIIGSATVTFPDGDNGAINTEQTQESFSVTGFSVRYADSYQFEVRSGNVLITNGAFSVNVDDVGFGPEVTLTYPADGAIFAPGQKVQISADVYDADGSISKVEFLLGNNTNTNITGNETYAIIGTVTSEPYTIEWEVPGIGEYKLSARAYDQKGNRRRSSVVSVFGSNTPILEELSSVEMMTPLDGGVLSTVNPITLSAIVQPEALRKFATVDYYLNGYKLNSTPVTDSSAGFFSYQWAEPYIGTHTITAIAQLNNGTFVESTTETKVSVVGIGSPPLVTLSQPAGGNIVVGTEVQFTAQAGDSGGLIEDVDFWVNGELVETKTRSQAPFNFKFKFPSSGPFDIWVVASFSNGNRAISNILNCEVELGSIPVVSMISPVEGMQFLPGTNLPILAMAYDPDSLIEELQYFVNDTPIATGVRSTDGRFLVNGTSSTVFDYGFSFSGTYRIYVQAKDSAGVIAQSETVTVNVREEDPTRPRVIMSHPLPVGGGDTVNDVSVGSSMFMNAIASDGDGEVEVVKFFINGQLIGSSTNQYKGTFSFYYSPTTPGDYVMFAEAVDNDGKRTHAVPIQLQVNALEANLPTVKMLPLAEEHRIVDAGTEITVSGEADGGLVEISQLNFYVNGVFVDSIESPAEGTDIYTAQLELEEPGTYFLNTRAIEVEPLGLPTDNWVVSDAVTVLVKARSNNRTFVEKVYRDFNSTVVPQGTLDQAVMALDSGQKTQAQYVYELIESESFNNTRLALMARFLLTGKWPNREVLRLDSSTVSLNQLVTTHLPTFQTTYLGGGRIPDAFSSQSEFENFAKIIFKNKYDKNPNGEQLTRCVDQMKLLGTELFVENFIKDNEAMKFGSDTISNILGIKNPPNTRLVDFANTAALFINLHRVTPTVEEVQSMSQQALISQIEQILADPKFTSR